jgi:hypothetical protein
VADVAVEQNSTLVMPIPVELLTAFGRMGGGGDSGNGRPVTPPPASPAPQIPPGPEEGRPPEPGNGRPG